MLAQDGHYLNIFNDGWERTTSRKWVVPLIIKHWTLAKVKQWLGLGPSYDLTFVSPDGASLERIGTLLRSGAIAPQSTQVLSFGDIPRALRELASLHATGKIVVLTSDEPKATA